MLIEAFSEAKDPSAPDTNEDRFVVLPGRAYAVIDGVTDRLGTRYNGMLSGQYAATIVKEALEYALTRPDRPTDTKLLIPILTQAIADAYRTHGTLDAARSDVNYRFSSTLTVALIGDETIDIALVGDTGIRINGSRILQIDKDLDLITSTLRQKAWPVIGARTSDPVIQEKTSRRVTWFGTRQPHEALADILDPQDLVLIEQHAVTACVQALPHVPQGDIETLVRGGIVNAQGAYQNNTSTILGYSALDGFEVPLSLVHFERLPRAEVRTIELFSDGYFRPGADFGVASWEEAFRDVEREDPAKVILYPSPKGSTATHWTDDRTYLGVKF
ncbi:PP2C family serine/threonine-protein phosphatase [Microvirga zambiensis]|uniref:PP2C family serine/threonine-protein phosphatase n=1 Tax=Microvirga zambiensis TaxID=1402137 RepID=UPI00191DC279|nr:PP2C family serine/threonine-protein phosphatase [Microvirga zambiensis]